MSSSMRFKFLIAFMGLMAIVYIFSDRDFYDILGAFLLLGIVIYGFLKIFSVRL